MAVATLAGCDPSLAAASAEAAERPTRSQAKSSLTDVPDPSSGWMEIESSPIVPWCGVVLVAPDVAVTATKCLQGVRDDEIRVGFGDPDRDRTFAIDRTVVLPGDRLAAIVLDQPFELVEPVGLDMPPVWSCEARGVSYLHVIRGEAADRWTWSGCASTKSTKTEFAVEQGAPNCHGEPGAGTFHADGSFLGIVVGGSGSEGCVDTLEIATPLSDGEAFDAALELSAPAV